MTLGTAVRFCSPVRRRGGVLMGLSSMVEEVWQFYVVWLAIGICLSGCLYEPCFAYLTRVMGGDARRAITRITLIAGFAGTVSFPIANVLAELYSWRAAVFAFAVVIVIVALPLFRYGTALPMPQGDALLESIGESTGESAGNEPGGKSDLRRAASNATFWLLATTFSMIGLTHGVIITHLLPMLAERQVPIAFAVLAASMIGPMQVAGRVAMITVENRVSMQAICALSFLFMAGAILALMGAGVIPWLLVVFVVLHGSGYGVTSITRPVVTMEILGRAGFGAISGALALGFMGASAAAPALAATIWTIGGYDLVRIFVLICVLIGASAFVTAVRMAHG